MCASSSIVVSSSREIACVTALMPPPHLHYYKLSLSLLLSESCSPISSSSPLLARTCLLPPRPYSPARVQQKGEKRKSSHVTEGEALCSAPDDPRTSMNLLACLRLSLLPPIIVVASPSHLQQSTAAGFQQQRRDNEQQQKHATGKLKEREGERKGPFSIMSHNINKLCLFVRWFVRLFVGLPCFYFHAHAHIPTCTFKFREEIKKKK